jgi:hypothetical protein
MNASARVQTLLAKWERFAESLAAGYDFDLDNYLNDLDVRQMLADAIARSEAAEAKSAEAKALSPKVLRTKLRAADAMVRRATQRVDTCLWGSRNAKKHGYAPDQNWWYFAVPTRRCAEFDRDLARVN